MLLVAIIAVLIAAARSGPRVTTIETRRDDDGADTSNGD